MAEPSHIPLPVCDWHETVRKRPGMYVGDTDTKGLHHVLHGVIDNACKEALAGHCDTVGVTLHTDDRVTITDNGRGISTEPVRPIHPHFADRSWLELALTVDAVPSLGPPRYAFGLNGGRHGLPLFVVNALTEHCEVITTRDAGPSMRLVSERGQITTPLHATLSPSPRGTRVTFRADPQVFPTTCFVLSDVVNHLEQLACLLPGVTFTLADERVSRKAKPYRHVGSLLDLLPTGDTPCFTGDVIDPDTAIVAQVAFRLQPGQPSHDTSFVNLIQTRDGGTHVDGMRCGLRNAVVSGHLPDGNLPNGRPRWTDGLIAAVAVLHPDPHLCSGTKSRLLNKDATRAVAQAFASPDTPPTPWSALCRRARTALRVA